ncbi:MAG: hypothetical protein BroJett025_07250 [Patescibacteria group bacterium]|nr:MAG: hypothetical protein BroJett025_07250 [Patescibacteria group bacterium]
MPDFFKKILKLLALGGLIVLPIKLGNKAPQATANQNGKDHAIEEDEEASEVLGVKTQELVTDLPDTIVGQFFVNETGAEGAGIVVDGEKNRYIKLQYTEESKQALLQILKLFHPEFSQVESEAYLEKYQMLVGDDVDYYLDTVRKGSWGTTVMVVSEDNTVHFRTISLRQFLIAPDYRETRPGALNQLIQEEFFQAHQYEAVVAKLYNNGYLSVAGIDSPEEVNAAISTGNLRAFLELFSQQKYLADTNLGRNSYNYYIDGHFFEGSASSELVVNNAYNEFVSFIQDKLGISCTIETFLSAESVKQMNETFRKKYLGYYTQHGVADDQVQIWNLVGMYRLNTANSDNTLNMRAVLDWPE